MLVCVCVYVCERERGGGGGWSYAYAGWLDYSAILKGRRCGRKSELRFR